MKEISHGKDEWGSLMEQPLMNGPIVLWPARVLKSRAFEVCPDEFNSPSLVELAGRLVSAMSLCGGVGLAAPQLGVPKRVFVMRLLSGEVLVAVNPSFETIEVEKGFSYLEEGCLSLPGINGQVERYRSVRMVYQKLDGVQEVQVFYDEPSTKDRPGTILARIAQHEMDHLDGVMFFDRMSRQQRRQVLWKWEEIKIR